ncbi:MAG: stage II sporulation protein P [Clostridia bacterium]
MFNVTVLKIGDIIKYLVGISIIVMLMVFTARYFSSTKENKNTKNFKILQANSLTKCMEQEIPTMASVNSENDTQEKNETSQNNYLEQFLQTEISSIKGIQEAEEVVEVEDKNENQNEITQNAEIKNDVQLAQSTNAQTEVVTPNPISENYNVQYGNVKIKNQTTYNLTEDILKPDIKIDNKNIVIFHTHSCESYTSSEKYPYTQTGNFRTTDLKYTVTQVGSELENYLKKYNLNVVHDTSYHDYPSYTGSYTRSLKTVENILQTTPSDIIIDLHRDAIGSRADYAPTVKIGDDYAAQIMFVIGTNEGGLYHPNWNQNLKFAVKVQQKAEEMYPGLFKPMMVTKSRYNQHTGKYANIMEVGATGNTLEQCLTSMKYLSAVLNEVMK